MPGRDISIALQFEDGPFELRIQHAPLDRPGRLHAEICEEERSILTLRRRHRSDRWAEDVGLSSRVRLGDPGFDDKIYLDADCSETWLRSALASAEGRDAAATLIAAGYELRIHDQGSLIVSALRTVLATGRYSTVLSVELVSN